ncbi:hypothetical protein P154DRAFT_595802 [Amniculicola lignicola CBS 123094]|uniref:DUF3074 domain-containing protein n=1 Tax=Amniculicola lignicola CBS 123094 TaxID=1392246 RepID=A0A6A5WVV3_9PLEO|nr:hypothetical protein P154DRAFT_595802 [Amniculicola lignicola CBS 123094]
MAELHQALSCLRPKDYAEIPLSDLSSYLSSIFANAELIANTVPPPPNGTPYESAQRTRTDPNPATSAADITTSQVRRPAPPPEHKDAELSKSWGKPLRLGAKETATGISVYKMAGHDRHGAWFARTSVHEGLGFAKWKAAMMSEFPESVKVEGGPGEGNIRGIGGDRRLEDVVVEGVGRMEVYQLSAQFPGPTAPREFITCLLTSENCLSEASKVGNTVPRHYMVVSIPVTHPDAPIRSGLVRGQYESVEMIREIPLASPKHMSASTTDLHKYERTKSRERGHTIGFAESRGDEAKGEKIDRKEEVDVHDPETNPVEWIMITRSDPGGGIPRFMVERGTPGSIVTDAGKFLDWACTKEDFAAEEEDGKGEEIPQGSVRKSFDVPRRSFSISESNGILAGVGTSIADFRNISSTTEDTEASSGYMGAITEAVTGAINTYVPDTYNPLQRRLSQLSHISSSTESSLDSFASAEQFNTAPEGLPIDVLPTPTSSEKSIPLNGTESSASGQYSSMSKELQRIEQKRQQLREQLDQAREKQGKETQDASQRSTRDLEKAAEKQNRERKRQEEKYQKEMNKLTHRRERETKKLLIRQQKEADKNLLVKTQKEREAYRVRAEEAERLNKEMKVLVGELQRENTGLVARVGKMEGGREVLRMVKEELEGGGGRMRASSRASAASRGR